MANLGVELGLTLEEIYDVFQARRQITDDKKFFTAKVMAGLKSARDHIMNDAQVKGRLEAFPYHPLLPIPTTSELEHHLWDGVYTMTAYRGKKRDRRSIGSGVFARTALKAHSAILGLAPRRHTHSKTEHVFDWWDGAHESTEPAAWNGLGVFFLICEPEDQQLPNAILWTTAEHEYDENSANELADDSYCIAILIRDVKADEEITACYGEDFERNYAVWIKDVPAAISKAELALQKKHLGKLPEFYARYRAYCMQWQAPDAKAWEWTWKHVFGMAYEVIQNIWTEGIAEGIEGIALEDIDIGSQHDKLEPGLRREKTCAWLLDRLHTGTCDSLPALFLALVQFTTVSSVKPFAIHRFIVKAPGKFYTSYKQTVEVEWMGDFYTFAPPGHNAGAPLSANQKVAVHLLYMHGKAANEETGTPLGHYGLLWPADPLDDAIDGLNTYEIPALASKSEVHSHGHLFDGRRFMYHCEDANGKTRVHEFLMEAIPADGRCWATAIARVLKQEHILIPEKLNLYDVLFFPSAYGVAAPESTLFARGKNRDHRWQNSLRWSLRYAQKRDGNLDTQDIYLLLACIAEQARHKFVFIAPTYANYLTASAYQAGEKGLPLALLNRIDDELKQGRSVVAPINVKESHWNLLVIRPHGPDETRTIELWGNLEKKTQAYKIAAARATLLCSRSVDSTVIFPRYERQQDGYTCGDRIGVYAYCVGDRYTAEEMSYALDFGDNHEKLREWTNTIMTGRSREEIKTPPTKVPHTELPTGAFYSHGHEFPSMTMKKIQVRSLDGPRPRTHGMARARAHAHTHTHTLTHTHTHTHTHMYTHTLLMQQIATRKR